MSDRFEDYPDVFVDQNENDDPDLCRTHGHIAYAVTLCDRCGKELRLHSTEETR